VTILLEDISSATSPKVVLCCLHNTLRGNRLDSEWSNVGPDVWHKSQYDLKLRDSTAAVD